MEKIEFLKQWFRGLADKGREVGIPERRFVRSFDEFIPYLNSSPCYLSVQPYIERNKVYAIERLFIESDSDDLEKAFEDIVKIKDRVEDIGAKAIVIFSGRRGYHLYVYLPKLILIDKAGVDRAKEFMRIMTFEILGVNFSTEIPKKYPTIDMKPSSDVKRIARVPFSKHEKTGKECHPIDEEGNYVIPDLKEAFQNPIPEDLCESIWNEVLEIERISKIDTPNIRKPRKKIAEVAHKIVEEGVNDGRRRGIFHILASRFIMAGYRDDEIVELCREFLRNSGADVSKYEYHIKDSIRRNREAIARGDRILFRIDSFIRRYPDLKDEYSKFLKYE